MPTRKPEARAEALRLAAETNLSKGEIAERLGVSTASIYRWLNPEKTKQYRENAKKASCPSCGAKMYPHATVCRRCRDRSRIHHKADEVVKLKRQGHSHFVIALSTGLTPTQVNWLLGNARKRGVNV